MKYLLTATLAVLLSAGSAAAQNKKWTDRGFISANAGFRATETTFDDNVTFTVNVEEGDFDASYKTPTAPIADIAGGVRLWRNFGVGVAVSTYTKSTTADITGRIPHPFFFDRDRDVSGSSDALSREELGVHVQALWMIPVSNRIDVAIFGGPSYFSLRQPLVQSLQYSESFPFDTATLTGTNSASATKTKVGFNVGGDVTYMLTKRFGVGGVVRVSHAQLRLDSIDGGTVTVDAGGAHAAGGVRLRF